MVLATYAVVITCALFLTLCALWVAIDTRRRMAQTLQRQRRQYIAVRDALISYVPSGKREVALQITMIGERASDPTQGIVDYLRYHQIANCDGLQMFNPMSWKSRE